MSFKKIAGLIPSLAFRFLYFLLALGVILFLTYLFGHTLLEGELKGSDSAFAFHNVYWYSRWWPKLPLWYPLQGGGFSLTLSYSIFQTWLTVLVEKATFLDLNQAFRMMSFAAYFLAALGIYVFGAWRLRNQTIGLMAAVFYLILPGIYWMIRIGLFAYLAATSLVPWAFVFFDFWLECFLDKDCSQRKRVFALFLASASFGVTTLFHILIGASVAIGLLIYGIVRGLTSARSGQDFRKRFFSMYQAMRGFGATCLCLVLGLALVSFWLFPYFYYNYIACRGGLAPEPVDIIVKESVGHGIKGVLFGKETLSLEGRLPLFQFPLVTSLTFLVGLIFALFLRRKTLALGMVAIFFIYWTGLGATLPLDWVKRLNFILALTMRSLTISQVILPLVAAFGVWQMARLIVKIPFLPLGLLRKKEGTFIKGIKLVFVFLLSWIIFISGLVFFERGIPGEKKIGYGPSDPFFYEAIREEPNYFYFRPYRDKVYAFDFFKNLPQREFEISNLDNPGIARAQEIVSLMPLDQFNRVAWSPYEGLSLQAFGNFTDASTLGQYMYRSSLFFGIRGYSEEVFFKGRGSSVALSDLARWIGYRYALTRPILDETSHYLPPDWQAYKEVKDVKIYEFQDHQGMATVAQRPVFLVIGKAMNAYEQVFKAAVEGVLPYHKAWLVEGRENIDDYTIEELEKFEGIILHGYSYKSANKAFSLLERYVKNGGRLFIDTGWQYTAKDWELDEAPAVFPVTGMRWSAEIPPGKYDLSSQEKQKLGLKQIPLEWNNGPWGVSVAKGTKPWGKPTLKIQGKTLVVEGEYGKGKVVWSGLNLFAYLTYQNYDRELINLGKSIFDYFLVDFSEEENVPRLSLSRDYPDKLEITLDTPLTLGAKLFWREPYSPQWKATLKEDGKTTKLSFYRAGPGFLLMYLPKTINPAKVVLEYKLGWEGFLGKLVTLVTLGGFLLIIIASDRLERIRLNVEKKIRNSWEREES